MCNVHNSHIVNCQSIMTKQFQLLWIVDTFKSKNQERQSERYKQQHGKWRKLNTQKLHDKNEIIRNGKQQRCCAVLCALCAGFFRQIICLKTNKCRLSIAVVGRCSVAGPKRRQREREKRKMKASCGICSIIVYYIAYRPLSKSRTAKVGHIICSRAQNIFFFLFKFKPLSVLVPFDEFQINLLISCCDVSTSPNGFLDLRNSADYI